MSKSKKCSGICLCKLVCVVCVRVCVRVSVCVKSFYSTIFPTKTPLYLHLLTTLNAWSDLDCSWKGSNWASASLPLGQKGARTSLTRSAPFIRSVQCFIKSRSFPSNGVSYNWKKVYLESYPKTVGPWLTSRWKAKSFFSIVLVYQNL